MIGEANFSDHGANRLGASALMQGLADGYFILPYTIGDYLASAKLAKVDADHPECRLVRGRTSTELTRRLLDINGKRTVDSFHRELGKIMWDKCGMARNATGLSEALGRIPELREEFWRNVNVPGSDAELNQALEKAGRVADFLELAELMCRDALHREESCGGHFREEYQTADGEALRDDEQFAYVARLGVRRARRRPPTAQGAADVRVRAPGPAELQVNLILHVWRQHLRERARGAWSATRRTTSAPTCRSSRCSMWSTSGSIEQGEEPIAFDHDCREGICGSCGLMINGVAHGPNPGTTACQLHMRSFKDGDEICVEPWRARAFPVVKDLVVDRTAFDRIIAAGGYISAPTGSARTRTRS